ncbi:Protein of unknown function (DUF3501) [Candidatus Kryptonium thompsonii]|uniref:DUF3501 family protein n=1 Tax=Candidatus Kryptonium thompsonii TaxID=1633631 RepID=A0A0P1P1L5_9BACT|nr:DUF3501 family protein [Candidatus Kryptonium thompsoni]CUS85494.1 Protein of unknown function (DUF3501) [Candidatus Kryptonium thompsoni]CUS86104.1 Protein of unknown function (DUF3501) [Candidatus Kryptonium thompsoni]CUS88592.1 Protein of unknown function (DUF3501) [Candidatus Kryptonium thompsoni]CUS90159.1 Protein of unknown function (DUF3501) [Candidatus Kryptonium thompsoni]CUT04677.1 Protein of unknown function (DUF3501) [Candidatus Kryptonium thompsoni]
MKKIELSEVKNIYEYEKIREDFRRYIIDLKKKRRVEVGNRVSLVFENRDTVLFQIQEMMRAERMVDDNEIKFEVDTYNELIPERNELSATLFIEVDDPQLLRPVLDSFIGLDRGNHVYLEIGNKHKIYAEFEEGHSKDDRISAVHFIKFKFKPEQIEDFKNFENEVKIVIDHPNYKAFSIINPETRNELIKDLESN